MHIRSLLTALSLSGLALCVLPSAANATDFGVNLIVNGNAEAGLGSPTGDPVVVPGWTTSSNFTAVTYGASGGFPFPSDPGPGDRGNNFFAGGNSNAFSNAMQLIDLSGNSASINSGHSQFDLSGWFGGYSSQGDNAVLTATFRDSNGGVLGAASIGAVSAADRGNATGLLLRDAMGFVPVGATSVALSLDMTRQDGSYNDGYADNLSFAMTSAVPEPGSVAMLLAGLGLLGLIAKRRQQ